jgi:DNA-binding NarL/FixJ family response regulator
LLVDDSQPFIDAATDLLRSQGLDVVGTATTGAEGVRLAEELRPDVVLVDVDLGPESGFDVTDELVSRGFHDVVLMSAYNEAEFVDLLAGSTALGFISKVQLTAERVVELAGSGRGER